MSPLHDRPAGMSSRGRARDPAGGLHRQAASRARLPVQFRLDGNPIDEVARRPDQRAAADAPQLDVLALVNITDPTEGRDVEGSFSADGVASSFEGTVPWELRDADGAVVPQGFAQGHDGGPPHAWETGPIDVSGLPPGHLHFVAHDRRPLRRRRRRADRRHAAITSS